MFVEDPKTGAWVPGKESPYPLRAPEGSHFVHVQFNALGHELAVVDDVGLVHLFIAPTGLGRTHVSATEFGFDRTGRSNSDAIAGLHWLPIFPTDFRVSDSLLRKMRTGGLTHMTGPLRRSSQQDQWILEHTNKGSRPKCS